MFFSNSKKVLLIVLFGLACVMPAFGQESSTLNSSQESVQLPQELVEEHNNYVENALKNMLVGYSSVDLILEDLALIIGSDQMPQVKNKKPIIEEIKNTRDLITTIKNDSYAQVDLYRIAILNKVLLSIIEHIDAWVYSDFKTFERFDIESCVNQAIKELSAVQDLDAEFAKIPKRLEELTYNAQNAGLYWYNKVYRVFDRYIIEPCDKYHVPRRTGKFLFGAFVAYLAWFHSDRGTCTTTVEIPEIIKDGSVVQERIQVTGNMAPQNLNHVADLAHNRQAQYWGWEYWLRYKVGVRPHFVSKMGDIDRIFHTANPLGWFGESERKIIEFNSGLMPIAALCLPYISSIYSNELAAGYDWIGKKIRRFHNFMKGGAYRKKTDDEKEKVEPKITFDDVVGSEHAKEILSLVVKYVEDPERWDRSKLTPERGYLLTGPTRTGKSFMAEALAGEIKKVIKKQNRNPDEFGYYVIKSSYIAQHGIAEILALAKREAPCVLFIDEIDLLGLQRAGGNKELLSEFLQTLGGAIENDPGKQVIILAATNCPQNMDEALKQRGRFGKEIRFERPNFDNRKLFLAKKLSSLSVNILNFDVDKIAYETEGYSFEDLTSMIKRAFQKAKIHGQVLSQALIEESLDSEIRNIIMNDYKKLPDSEKQIIAAHQAGHALTTLLLPTGQKLAKVTIRPLTSKLKEEVVWDQYYKDEEDKQKPTDYGKIFTYHDYDTINVMSREQKINLCKMHLAGHIAEEILLGSCGYSYHAEDRQKSLDIAKSMIFGGLKVDRLPKKTQNQLFDQAFALLKQCEAEVKELLIHNKEKLVLLATTLQKVETLTAEQIEKLLSENLTSTAAKDTPQPSAA